MTGRITSQRKAATRLLKLQRQSRIAGEAPDEPGAAGRLLEALFASLGPVLGAAGVEAIFARSIKLSKAEYSPLGELVTAGSGLPPRDAEAVAQRLVECLSKLEPSAAREIATGLFATFLELLSSFVGEELLWQIVNGAFVTAAEGDFEETE